MSNKYFTAQNLLPLWILTETTFRKTIKPECKDTSAFLNKYFEFFCLKNYLLKRRLFCLGASKPIYSVKTQMCNYSQVIDYLPEMVQEDNKVVLRGEASQNQGLQTMFFYLLFVSPYWPSV